QVFRGTDLLLPRPVAVGPVPRRLPRHGTGAVRLPADAELFPCPVVLGGWLPGDGPVLLQYHAQSDHLGGADVRISFGLDRLVLHQTSTRVRFAMERSGELRVAPRSVDQLAARQPCAAPADVPRNDGDLLFV